jgi:hypothetical protein
MAVVNYRSLSPFSIVMPKIHACGAYSACESSPALSFIMLQELLFWVAKPKRY